MKCEKQRRHINDERLDNFLVNNPKPVRSYLPPEI